MPTIFWDPVLVPSLVWITGALALCVRTSTCTTLRAQLENRWVVGANGVRHALAGIERARLSEERLSVWTPSSGSRRERFASRRVGEYVSSDERVYRFDGSTVLVIKTDVTHPVTHQTTHILPPAGTLNALDESHKKRVVISCWFSKISL
ncbi:hypothetical protein EMIHUDRAFT_230032 [Emiliania huxleyi CCMP1516]|uniref:Uncharacterized protein n=2 Tax=Emiliania huxleyi TaxID=2903 RepID=A0A0D3KBB4_EMIH1|nr:hypothetical protein EMIHUDRAFT_230032 [Emiliania huxleyi CCMP1516]EOD33049.1 hypothetical protein EMIHUDRAFT_230032 [Emiliania huxleyi CCMP1516]|eukprot:XP_005785478.1 hypothetical protein EMIHUDRAFT_230032 [Emiliania huxleyi CCMP1516]